MNCEHCSDTLRDICASQGACANGYSASDDLYYLDLYTDQIDETGFIKANSSSTGGSRMATAEMLPEE